MLLPFALPIIAAVAVAYRYLQLYAPTNLLVRRLRDQEPRWRTAAVLVVLSVSLLVAMHFAATATTTGGPGWLNLVVVVLAWDAIKVGCRAIVEFLRRLRLVTCTLPRTRRQARASLEGAPLWTSVGRQGYPADL